MDTAQHSRVIELDWLAASPIGPYVVAFKRHLTERRYAAHTVASYVAEVTHFARWVRGGSWADHADRQSRSADLAAALLSLPPEPEKSRYSLEKAGRPSIRKTHPARLPGVRPAWPPTLPALC